MEDISAIQDDIARMIVDTLKIELLGEKKAPLVQPGTSNLEAYNLYLQARYLWNTRKRENLIKSIGYFEKALAIDPKYALAYAGLADAYFILGNNLFLPPDEAYPKAKELALKALQIDNELASAYSVLGSVKRDYEWDFEGAERDLKRAIEVDPNHANAHHYYAFLLSFLGRHEQVIKEIMLAHDLDPVTPRIRANVGFVLYLARRYDEALAELEKALEFDSSHAETYKYLGDAHRECGHFEESIANFLKAIKLEDLYRYTIKLAVTYARAGKVKEARDILGKIMKQSKKEYISSALLAAAHGALGETETAFRLLDQAYQERDSRLTFLNDPIYDPLRSDPRHAELLKKLGLQK